MSNYAMLVNNIVIEVLLNQEEEPRFPRTPRGEIVEAIPCEETVERGMIYNPVDKTFSEYIPEKDIPELTQLERIEEKIDLLISGGVNQELEQYYSTVNAALNGGV